MKRSSIDKTREIFPDQSVVVIFDGTKVPECVKISKSEREYANSCLQLDKNFVLINSYFKNTYLIRVKKDADPDRVREDLRCSASKIISLIKRNNHDELVITSIDTYHEAVLDFTEGFILSSYEFDKYKTDKDAVAGHYPGKLLLYSDVTDKEITWLTSLVDAVWFVRDMLNEPVSVMNSLNLAAYIQEKGNLAGFSVDILNGKQIEALKMGGLLAVNRGSIDPPVFCILEWNPDNTVNDKPFVLVGKGITYDTGGLNLKPGNYMDGMKGDMAGAAVVAGVMYVIARNRLPVHVIGLIPATDNRPGGNAYTQDDIITMFNKKTVEIKSTDAEGRLILADAISYASKYKPELIIDIATLTGSAAVTFGNQAIAMMTNADRSYVSTLITCSHNVHERVAELPLWEEYGELIKSDVADLKNISSGKDAGAITAGKFLEQFAEYPLIHLDIAGTAIIDANDNYRLGKYTGSGLRLLAAFLKKLTEKTVAK